MVVPDKRDQSAAIGNATVTITDGDLIREELSRRSKFDKPHSPKREKRIRHGKGHGWWARPREK